MMIARGKIKYVEDVLQCYFLARNSLRDVLRLNLPSELFTTNTEITVEVLWTCITN